MSAPAWGAPVECACVDCGRSFGAVEPRSHRLPSRCPECRAAHERVQCLARHHARRRAMGLGMWERALKVRVLECEACGLWFEHESYGGHTPKRCPLCARERESEMRKARRRARKEAVE